MWLDVGALAEEYAIIAIQRRCSGWKQGTAPDGSIELRDPAGNWLVRIGPIGDWQLSRLDNSQVITGDLVRQFDRAMEEVGLQ